MAQKPDVVIEFGAELKALRSQLASVVSEVRGTADQVGVALGRVQRPAREGAEAVGGLQKSLAMWANEQRSQGRQARFYAQEIADIIPAADGARGTLQGLASVFIEGAAGGLSFGLALEAVKFSVGIVTDYLEDAARRAEAVLKASRQRADETMAALVGLGRAVDAISGSPLTATEQAIRENTDEANKKLREQDRLLQDMRDRGEDLDRIRGGDRGSGMEVQSEKYKRALEDREAIRRDGLERERQLRERGSGEERAINEKQLKAEEVAKLQHEASTMSGVAAIRKKLEADLKILDADRELQEGARETRRVHLEQQADDAIAKYRLQKKQELALALAQIDLEMRRTQRSAVEQVEAEGAVAVMAIDQQIALARQQQNVVELANLEKLKKATQDLAAERARLAGIKSQFSDPSGPGKDESAGQSLGKTPGQIVQDSDLEKEKAKAAEKRAVWLGAASSIQSAWSNAMAGMLKGQLSLAEGMKAAWQGIADSVIQSLSDMIAKLAVWGALTSIFGPIAGLSPGPLGTLLGIGGGAPVSLDVGAWKLPSDTFAKVHKGEMVVPAAGGQADAVRAMLSGGAGGTVYNVSIYATDAGSFFRANRRTLVSEITSAIRSGELK